MTKHLVRSIESLKAQVLALGSAVEKSVENAVRSALTYDAALAESVIKEDSNIDSMEVDVEEECLKILALHQPVASDLRFIVAILKMNNDLERIGDLAVNIAWRAIDLVKEPRSELLFDISGMAKESRSMLEKSLNALVELDAETAKAVLRSDDIVDEINREKESFAILKEQLENDKNINNNLLKNENERFLYRKVLLKPPIKSGSRLPTTGLLVFNLYNPVVGST